MATAAVPQPIAAPPSPGRDLTARLRYQRMHAALVQERSSFVPHWQSINKVLYPRRGRFFVTDQNKGDRRNKDIIDSTATFAARTLAAGMMSGITSPARNWFRLTTPDPDLAEYESVKEWLQFVTERIQTILLKSNFYNQVHRLYGDLGVYGTAPMLVEEDEETVIRCYTMPVGSYCLANDEKLRVRTFTREFQMTTRQMVATFGYERCSSAVRTSWDHMLLDAWFQVLHVVTTNDGYRTTDYGSRPFVSCYIDQTARDREDGVLRESGYEEFPILAARWDVTGEDVYATDCPGMTALGDVMQLQFGEKKGMQALEKMINPPLVSPVSLRREPISQLPAGVTYDDTDSSKGVRPLHEINPAFDKLLQVQNQVRSRINSAFFADLWLMQSYLAEMGGAERPTAREVDVREEEKMLVLGPVLEQLNADVFNQLIHRVFKIAARRGQFPPSPPELHGMELKVEYLSIMHAAQKAGSLSQIERFSTYIINLATGAQKPDVLDTVDTDKMVEQYHDAAGIAASVLRSTDQIAAMRTARAKKQAAQDQIAAMSQAAAGAKDLSQADTTGKNGLTDLLAQAGAGA